jgi:hypothetical protein
MKDRELSKIVQTVENSASLKVPDNQMQHGLRGIPPSTYRGLDGAAGRHFARAQSDVERQSSKQGKDSYQNL